MRKFLLYFFLLIFVGIGSAYLLYQREKPIDLHRNTIVNEHAEIADKVLICGIGRNIEAAVPNTIASIAYLGSKFLDYRAIIYENNSTDGTKKHLKKWAEQDPHVILISEQVSSRKLKPAMVMGFPNRTEKLARARNIVLRQVMNPLFDDYQYVIWADLDFLEPWDVDAVVQTIQSPQEPFDAVLANGSYDLFALRSPEFPIGFELAGDIHATRLDEIWSRLTFDPEGKWMKVYSAFGGLGIYKRDSIRNCWYSGTVTKDLEKAVQQWISIAKRADPPCFFSDYQALIAKTEPLILKRGERIHSRSKYPNELAVRFEDSDTIWFSCRNKETFPWTCEHIPFHASMIMRGHDRIFINPKIRSNP